MITPINAALTMLLLMLIVLVLLFATGCSTITYREGTSEFTRTSWGTNLQIGELRSSIDKNGLRRIELRGYQSEQTEALEAVAAGVARGLANGAKP